MLPAMGGNPAPPAQTTSQTRFSADGFWWWDGSQWRPAMSEDRLWRWSGSTWEPARTAGGSGSGASLGIMIGVLAGILVLVAAITFAVIYFAGPDISNVFSNLVATPSSP
jgi:hypothetical protein